MQLTNKALSEQKTYNLLTNEGYISSMQSYINLCNRRPPSKDVSNRNMLKALRMCPHLNTADEWARLHVIEYFFQKNRKYSNWNY